MLEKLENFICFVVLQHLVRKKIRFNVFQVLTFCIGFSIQFISRELYQLNKYNEETSDSLLVSFLLVILHKFLTIYDSLDFL